MIFIRFHKGYAIYWICCFVRSPPPLFWELTPTPRAPSKSPSYCINGFQCSVTLFLIYGWLVKGWVPKLHWANPSPSLRIWIWALFKKSCFFPVQLLDIKPRAVNSCVSHHTIRRSGGAWSMEQEKMEHIFRNASLTRIVSLFLVEVQLYFCPLVSWITPVSSILIPFF